MRVPEVAGNSDRDYITLHWGRADAADSSDGAAVFRAEDGFRGAWHLDGTGPEARDASANGYHGEAAATFGVDGVLGKAYAFSGLDDRVALPRAALEGLRSFTVTLWARETAPRACEPLLLCPSLFGGESADYGTGDLWIGSNQGRLAYQTGLKGGSDTSQTTAISLADGKWHFVAVRYDGSSLSFFEAGASAATTAVTGLPIDAAFDIGNIAWSDGTRRHAFGGSLDAVQLYGAARPAHWIKLAYETQRPDGKAVVLKAAVSSATGLDSLRPGDILVLPGGHSIRYPAEMGNIDVALATGGSLGPAPPGFDPAGPLFRVGDPGGAAFPLLLAGSPPESGKTALYRIDGDGSVRWMASGEGELAVAGPGTYFRGTDMRAPRAVPAGMPAVSADTLRAVYRLEDNVRNLRCRLRWWNGGADSTAWTDCEAGGEIAFRLPIRPGGHRPLEIRFESSDHANASGHPDGAAHVLTVSRPLPAGPGPVSLEADSWRLAALPLRGGPLRMRELEAANRGLRLSAGMWRSDPRLPGEGDYRILAPDDTLSGGQGFWLHSREAVSGLSLPAAASLPSDTSGAFPVRLVRGWNLVASPSLRALGWIVSRSDPEAYIRSPVKILHRHRDGAYGETDTLSPWEGYFVYSHSSDTVIRLYAPMPGGAPLEKAVAVAVPGAGEPPGGLGITLSRAGSRSELRLGARGWAGDGIGIEDEPLPPAHASTEPGPRLVREGRALGTDVVRMREGEAMAWTLAGARSGTAGRLEVSRARLPEGFEAWAFHPAGMARRRLDSASALALPPGDTIRVYAGTPASLAALPWMSAYREAPAEARLSLQQAAGGTALALGLPGSARITWRILRADGSRRLAAGALTLGPGWHRLPLWEGEGPARGVHWIEAEVSGEGWRLRRVLPFFRF